MYRLGFYTLYVLCLWLRHRIFSFDWLPWSKPAVAIMPPLLKTKEGPNIAKTAQFQNKPPSVWNQKASLYVQIYYTLSLLRSAATHGEKQAPNMGKNAQFPSILHSKLQSFQLPTLAPIMITSFAVMHLQE